MRHSHKKERHLRYIAIVNAEQAIEQAWRKTAKKWRLEEGEAIELFKKVSHQF